MKKVLSTLFAAAFIALVACGPSAEEKAAAEQASSAMQEQSAMQDSANMMMDSTANKMSGESK